MQSNTAPVEENPGWVRKCAEAFKKDKCMLTHEMRTIDNWRRFNHRVESSPYKFVARTKCDACDSIRRSRNPEPCACHDIISDKLPHLNSVGFPPELWGPPQEAGAGEGGAGEGQRKRKLGASGGGRGEGSVRIKKEPGGDDVDDQATALLGDEGLAPIKLTNEDLKRGEEEAAPGPNDKEAGGGGGSDKGEGDDAEDDDGDDLEDADYGAGDRYDDDDDLTNDDGEASDNEEARYGTY